MTPERITTLEEFWPFYLGEHSRPLTRALHFFGTSLALLQLVYAIVTLSWEPLVAAVISAYFCAWASHFFIEKNRPATFSYPLWSFVCDWRMWAAMAVGRLDEDLKKYGVVPKTAQNLAVKS